MKERDKEGGREGGRMSNRNSSTLNVDVVGRMRPRNCFAQISRDTDVLSANERKTSIHARKWHHSRGTEKTVNWLQRSNEISQ